MVKTYNVKANGINMIINKQNMRHASLHLLK